VTLDILRKTGGWCVELQQPLKLGPNHEIAQIEIRPSTADHMIRWVQEKIPSTLALLSELCDVPERALRQLPSHDFDRVMLAFHNILPAAIRQDWTDGTRPLATPEEDIPVQQAMVPGTDQLDPRFPAAEGPVVRMGNAPLKPPSRDDGDGSGMNMDLPPILSSVR
jgi:hypothetical protein